MVIKKSCPRDCDSSSTVLQLLLSQCNLTGKSPWAPVHHVTLKLHSMATTKVGFKA